MFTILSTTSYSMCVRVVDSKSGREFGGYVATPTGYAIPRWLFLAIWTYPDKIVPAQGILLPKAECTWHLSMGKVLLHHSDSKSCLYLSPSFLRLQSCAHFPIALGEIDTWLNLYRIALGIFHSCPPLMFFSGGWTPSMFSGCSVLLLGSLWHHMTSRAWCQDVVLGPLKQLEKMAALFRSLLNRFQCMWWLGTQTRGSRRSSACSSLCQSRKIIVSQSNT